MTSVLNLTSTGYEKVTRKDGVEEWYLNGKLHRDGDKPAVIHPDGTQWWYQHGLFHRDGDKPAIIHHDGTQWWYQHGKLHRDGDKPAVVHPDGSEYWFQNGKLHRGNNLPAAIESNETKEWWVNGERHRLKGVAVIGATAEKPNRWFLYDKETTEHQHKAFIKQIASEGQGLDYFQSLPYEYQKNVFTTLLNRG